MATTLKQFMASIKPEEMYETIALTGVLRKLNVHELKQCVNENGFPNGPNDMEGQGFLDTA